MLRRSWLAGALGWRLHHQPSLLRIAPPTDTHNSHRMVVACIFAPLGAIQVIIAGLGRSGSSSLNEALAQLNYTMVVGFPDLVFLDEFQRLSNGTIDDSGFLAQVAEKGYTAAGYDMAPLMNFANAAKTGAKIILTERDSADVWATSVLATIATHKAAMIQRPFTFIKAFRVLRPTLDKLYAYYNDGEEAHVLTDRERLKRAYTKHSEKVKASVPRHRLLIFNVKQGWPPLCRFLDVEEGSCPTGPFPWAMSSFEMKIITFVFHAATWVWPLIPIVPVLAAFGCVRCFSRGTASPRNNAKRA